MKHLILIICLFILFGDLNAQSISSEKYNKHLVREDFNNKQGHFKTITTNENYFILDKGDYLMSRHNSKSEYSIIANSTFSLLSSYLSKKSIICLAPKMWFHKKKLERNKIFSKLKFV